MAPGHILTYFTQDPLSPDLKTPTLPPSPTAEDYERAREGEKAKGDQARRRAERIKRKLEELSAAADRVIEKAQPSSSSSSSSSSPASMDSSDKSDSQAPSPAKQPRSSPPNRSSMASRKSSLNGAAAPFVPSAGLHDGGRSSSSPDRGA